MPYTAKQGRYFHAAAERGEPGMAKLAKEAEETPTLPPKRRYVNNSEYEKRLKSSFRSEKPKAS